MYYLLNVCACTVKGDYKPFWGKFNSKFDSKISTETRACIKDWNVYSTITWTFLVAATTCIIRACSVWSFSGLQSERLTIYAKFWKNKVLHTFQFFLSSPLHYNWETSFQRQIRLFFLKSSFALSVSPQNPVCDDYFHGNYQVFGDRALLKIHTQYSIRRQNSLGLDPARC